MLQQSKREFLCDIGETITVEVTSEGTVHNVAFAKDGEDWDGQPFQFTEPANESTSITLFLVFSNPSGGKYNIKISGKPGEFVHQESVPQDDEFGSVSDAARGYDFFKKA
jgi:hypothetical protein